MQKLSYKKLLIIYGTIRPDLGYDFALEVYAAISRAESYSMCWALIDASVRRSLVSRFPYGVLYADSEKGIYILAVMNLHRKPGYWQNRK